MHGQDTPEMGPDSNSSRRATARHQRGTVRKTGRDSGSARQDVVDAAIGCILELGFYRASSNAIAERAGVTWGVIQYHFGNREKLMLAVLEEGSRRLADDLRSAEITGTGLAERMEEFFDILAEYYGSPDYLAFIQVVMNLSHDQNTSEQTRQTLSQLNEQANPEVNRLLSQVIADTVVDQHDARGLLFHALRGLSMSYIMLTTLEPLGYAPAQHQFLANRRLLAQALSLLMENPRARPAD